MKKRKKERESSNLMKLINKSSIKSYQIIKIRNLSNKNTLRLERKLHIRDFVYSINLELLKTYLNATNRHILYSHM